MDKLGQSCEALAVDSTAINAEKVVLFRGGGLLVDEPTARKIIELVKAFT